MKKLIVALPLVSLLLGGAEIHSAAQKRDLEAVKKIVASGVDIDAALAKTHQTALHIAAANEDGPLIDFLLKRGADVNARTIDAQSPLYTLSYLGNAKLMQRLIDSGARVNVKDENGDAPLHKAAEGGKGAAVELLLKSGADVNAQNHGGETPLHVSAYVGTEEPVWVLLQHGADVRLKNVKEMTAAEVAYEEDNWRIMKIIRKLGK